jgi:hypothetical protein
MIASPATSTDGLDTTSTRCGKCTGVCICSEIESHPIILTRPSSPDSAPPPTPAGFEHPSHRFDRSWQQPESQNTAHESIKSICPASDDNPGKSWQPVKEQGKLDLEKEKTMKQSETSLAELEAERRKNPEPNSSPKPNDEVYESDDAEGEAETSEDEAQPSPFQPIAGMRGKFPRNWRNRHVRSESPDDHWHRRL